MPRLSDKALPLLAVISVACAGCGTGSDLGSTDTGQSADATRVSSGTIHVVMKSLDFSPNSIKGKVGETVTWTNEDEAPHNVTYVSGPKFTSSRPQLTIGQTFALRLTQPGT